jgi:predicted RNase H-like HicB family nuclease
MAMATRHVILYQDDDGCWIAECLSLPGCAGNGETKSEAISHIRERIRRHLREIQNGEEQIPEEEFDIVQVNV